MITYVQGGFFASPAQTLVNTVNTVGVMGKGLAKEFKAVWPEMYEAYAERCAAGDLVPGSLHLWRSPHKWVLNFPTKRHWRQRSRIEDVDAGLRTFAATWADHGITGVAFPQLGCGNGGLDWEGQVRPLMERWLAPLPIDVFVHVADGGALLPASSAGEALVAWLRGDAELGSFDRFWAGLLVAAETAGNGWVRDADGVAFAPDGEDVLPVAREDWRRVWQGLRAGPVGPDAAAPVGVPAGALFGVLERMPGVAATRAVALPESANPGSTVSQLFAEPLARAFRYDPVTDNAPAFARPGGDGDGPWSVSTPSKQSQLPVSA